MVKEKTSKIAIKKVSKKTKNFFKSLKFENQKQAIIIVAVLIVLYFVYLGRSWLFVAVVNNRPITRWAFNRELQAQAGKQILENQIAEKLILQKAKVQGIEVSQEEITQQIKVIEDNVKIQGDDLDTLLAAQGQTRADLEKDIRIQALIEKTLAKEVNVTDEEIANYFEENLDSFAEGTTLEAESQGIKDLLTQQKTSTRFQTWLEELKQEARIYYLLKI